MENVRLALRRWKWLAIGALAVTVYYPLSGLGEAETPSPLEGLRDILRDAQLSLLPQDSSVTNDIGGLLLLSDGTWLPADIPVTPEGGFYIIFFEDRDTRHVLFLDVDGATLHELPPEAGYSPSWVYEALSSPSTGEGVVRSDGVVDSEIGFPPSYDPSLVSLRAALMSPFVELFPTPTKGKSPDVEPSSVTEVGDVAEVGDVIPLSPTETFFLDPLSTTNLLEMVKVPIPFDAQPDAVYVDARNGDDSFTGSRAVIASVTAKQPSAATSSPHGEDGPKRTVSGGMSTLGETHNLVIREGDYAETLDVRGRDVRVKIEGTVKLGAPMASPPNSVSTAFDLESWLLKNGILRKTSPTNTVSNATE